MHCLKTISRVVGFCVIAAIVAGCATLSGKKTEEKPIDTIPMYGQPGTPRPDNLKRSDEDFIREAVRLYGGSREAASRAWAQVANDIFETGRLDEAMRRYNQSWLLNENNYQPYWGFGQIMSKRGRIDEAIRFYEKAKQLIDDEYQKPALYDYLGVMYSRKARNIRNDKEAQARYFAIANQYFKASAELDKTYADVWEGWANSLYFEGNYAECWDKVKRADAAGRPVRQGFREALRKAMPEPQ